jgi:hypothetical protein
VSGGLVLDVLPGEVMVARLPARAPDPPWARGEPLAALVRCAGELSVVCPAGAVPDGVRRDGPWRVLRVRGPLDLALTGILARLLEPLGAAGVPVFPLATFDTDLILVPAGDLERAASALRAGGHRVERPAGAR